MWVGRVRCRRGQEEASVGVAGGGVWSPSPSLRSAPPPIPGADPSPPTSTDCQPRLSSPPGVFQARSGHPVCPQKQCLQCGVPEKTRVGRWEGRWEGEGKQGSGGEGGGVPLGEGAGAGHLYLTRSKGAASFLPFFPFSIELKK